VRPIGPPPPPVSPFPTGGIFRSHSSSVAGSETTSGIGSVAPTRDATSDFSKMLLDKFDEVNSMQTDADDKVHQMLTGGDVNQAEVLTAVQKADLAFRMMLQVRNKLIEAYRELQQIQI
jgi:flagellar hook-basal body complex protein FliE